MYTISFKKGSIELEITTTDKAFVERQLDSIVYQASSCDNPIRQEFIQPVQEELRENPQYIENTQEELPKEDLLGDVEVQPQNVEPAQFHQVTEEEKKLVIQNAEDVVPQSLDIGHVRPITINSLQNPEPEQEVASLPDFDNILNKEMNNQNGEAPILKDEKFIEFVESKSAIEKFDFLIITAQYLAQYEGVITFNLKHINAKLMQNFTLIVDHSILQSAIAREYITRIQEGSDDSSSEYMLTEKGLRSY